MKNKMDYRNSHTRFGKGVIYDDNFQNYTWRLYLWGREQKVLKKILSMLDKRNAHLDFACGTGRVLEYMQQFVTTSTGLDISESMLEICRCRVKQARIIKADITRETIFNQEKFDLITAFRFFSNAQNSLRVEAMRAISELLTENGVLIFNNHKNATNGFYWLSKLFNKKKVAMTLLEAHHLIQECGLEIVKIYPIGVLPSHESFMLLPGWVSTVIDRLVCSTGFGEVLCQNIIYVCKKKAI
jgi:predicted TPR repeat methyltransferase